MAISTRLLGWLAQYLKEQSPDLILAGNVAIDGGSGQVGPRVAEQLEIPYITTITKLDIEGEKVTVVRDVEGDLRLSKRHFLFW